LCYFLHGPKGDCELALRPRCLLIAIEDFSSCSMLQNYTNRLIFVSLETVVILSTSMYRPKEVWIKMIGSCLCGAGSKSTNCNVDTFVVSPTSGRLEAIGSLSSKHDSVISVRFTAHSCETFEASFVFRGLLEEKTCYVRVCGQGTYDGHYEAVANV